MPALYLTEADVRDLVTIHDAIPVVSQAFQNLGDETAVNMPRTRLRTDRVMMHMLAGADRQQQQLGWKIYTTTRSGARFLVGIYDANSGELAALLEADFLGQLRTAAASGVATDLLAKRSTSVLGIIGSGVQARTQAWAMCAVRSFDSIRVFSRDPQHRLDFAQLLSNDLQQEVEAVEQVEDVVRHSDVLVTATNSQTPVLSGTDLPPGVHINAIGANFLKRSELDLDTFRRTRLVICDSIAQCRQEAGDFVAPLQAGLLEWSTLRELSDVVRGTVSRRDEQEITLFKSVGLGLEDVALGALIVSRAREQGRGIALPF